MGSPVSAERGGNLGLDLARYGCGPLPWLTGALSVLLS
jgi:hypothetical protein